MKHAVATGSLRTHAPHIVDSMVLHFTAVEIQRLTRGFLTRCRQKRTLEEGQAAMTGGEGGTAGNGSGGQESHAATHGMDMDAAAVRQQDEPPDTPQSRQPDVPPTTPASMRTLHPLPDDLSTGGLAEGASNVRPKPSLGVASIARDLEALPFPEPVTLPWDSGAPLPALSYYPRWWDAADERTRSLYAWSTTKPLPHSPRHPSGHASRRENRRINQMNATLLRVQADRELVWRPPSDLPRFADYRHHETITYHPMPAQAGAGKVPQLLLRNGRPSSHAVAAPAGGFYFERFSRRPTRGGAYTARPTLSAVPMTRVRPPSAPPGKLAPGLGGAAPRSPRVRPATAFPRRATAA